MMYRTTAIACLLMLAFLTPSTGGCSEPPPLDTVQLMTDITTLAADDMEGREPGTPGGRKAREYIRARFVEEGLKAYPDGYLQPFEFTERRSGRRCQDCANVVGYIPGRSPRAIVITAHYDHLGRVNGQIFNGADDNASGVATLLAVARYFKARTPAHTLVFVAFDAEEKGLRGARHFVEHPPLPLADVRLNINMDMVSVSSKGELHAAGTHHFPALRPILEQLPRLSGVTLKLGHDRPDDGENDWSTDSDHAPFFEKKIPFIYFGVEDHPNYHQPGDRVENIDPAFFKAAAALINSAVGRFDAGLSTIAR